jgi:N-methylhydantoinase A/oxoprolinase/acetone carboxylase beta subunit
MAPPTSRDVYWRDFREFRATNVYEGPSLSPGSLIDGPSIIDYPDTTVVLPLGASAEIDELGNVVIDVGNEPARSASGIHAVAAT